MQMPTASGFSRSATAFALVGALALLTGCAGPAGNGAAPSNQANAAAPLTCLVPTSCIASREGTDYPPLRIDGTAAQAMAALRATLASFPEATIERSDAQSIDAVFSTRIGFKDEVNLRVLPGGPAAQQVAWRSRSLAAVFDWGKNRSRMREFAERFAARAAPTR